MKLYNVAYSGNSYKVRLLLSQLGIPCETIEVDILNGESRTAEFLKLNPNGRTPVLDDNGFLLAESNAILTYLAKGTKFLPEDRKAFGQVFQWMFFEQYSHEPYVAVARSVMRYTAPRSPERANLPRLHERGNKALRVMDQHLQKEPFFAAGRYTIADISLYAYTHCAGDGGFDLERYPALNAWLARVKSQPRHVPLAA